MVVCCRQHRVSPGHCYRLQPRSDCWHSGSVLTNVCGRHDGHVLPPAFADWYLLFVPVLRLQPVCSPALQLPVWGLPSFVPDSSLTCCRLLFVVVYLLARQLTGWQADDCPVVACDGCGSGRSCRAGSCSVVRVVVEAWRRQVFLPVLRCQTGW